jgi:hypothetical protein
MMRSICVVPQLAGPAALSQLFSKNMPCDVYLANACATVAG